MNSLGVLILNKRLTLTEENALHRRYHHTYRAERKGSYQCEDAERKLYTTGTILSLGGGAENNHKVLEVVAEKSTLPDDKKYYKL